MLRAPLRGRCIDDSLRYCLDSFNPIPLKGRGKGQGWNTQRLLFVWRFHTEMRWFVIVFRLILNKVRVLMHQRKRREILLSNTHS